MKRVALFTRAWIEMPEINILLKFSFVALFTRAWIEMTWVSPTTVYYKSPSSRGRGLK